MTMGVHHADTLQYYFGPVKNVFAFFSKLYTPADVEDVTMTTFQFESGVLGYLGFDLFLTPGQLDLGLWDRRPSLLQPLAPQCAF